MNTSDDCRVCTLASGDPLTSRKDRLLKHIDLLMTHLTPLQKAQLEDCLVSFTDVFALDTGELGSTTLAQHSISTGDHSAIKQPAWRMPFVLRETLKTLVKDMLSQGVIVPSQSQWASPNALVKKKNGDMRFCVDYRKLNHVTKLDEFPLPQIDETLDLLAGAKYFTTLDLAWGIGKSLWIFHHKRRQPSLPTLDCTSSRRCRLARLTRQQRSRDL